MALDNTDKEFLRKAVGSHNSAINETFKSMDAKIGDVKKDIKHIQTSMDAKFESQETKCDSRRSDIFKRIQPLETTSAAQGEAVKTLKNGVSKQSDRSWGFLILVISMVVTMLLSLGTLLITILMK